MRYGLTRPALLRSAADFQHSATLGTRVKVPLKVFEMTFGAKTTCMKSDICEFTKKWEVPDLEELRFFGPHWQILLEK